jgi:hypothetical protein
MSANVGQAGVWCGGGRALDTGGGGGYNAFCILMCRKLICLLDLVCEATCLYVQGTTAALRSGSPMVMLEEVTMPQIFPILSAGRLVRLAQAAKNSRMC